MRNGTATSSETTGETSAMVKAGSTVFEDYKKHNSAPQHPTHLYILSSLRAHYPEYAVTAVDSEAGLLEFAKDGQASADLDIRNDNYSSIRSYFASGGRTADQPGTMSDEVQFGKYDYQWKDHRFIVYTATYQQIFGFTTKNFVLHKRENELCDGRSEITDQLITAATQWAANVHGEVLVFDREEWEKDKALWDSVQVASWDDVIIDKTMKETLIDDVVGFFDSKKEYKEFAVPWKRGIIFHGLPGNGKTITIKALMNALYARPDPVPTLYVKSLAGCHGPEYAIREIFVKARRTTPCLLIFEDLDSLIQDKVKSFFLNEIDGLESNEGLMILGSTNHLERLDAGISKRPGRFDRKYHFTLPAKPERVKYCDYWRSKLAKNKTIDFPPKLTEAIAEITEGFSFAYLKETFVTSLLMIVGSRRGNKEIEGLGEKGDEYDRLDELLLWRVVKKQIKTLREEMEESRKSAEEAAKNNDATNHTPSDASKATCQC